MREFVVITSVLLSGCNVFLGLDSVEPVDQTTTTNTTSGPMTNGGTPTPTPTPTPVDPPPVVEPLVCTDSCTCNRDCGIDCADCIVDCPSGSVCTGSLGGGSAKCSSGASCELGCPTGSCEFTCTDRDADCYIDCADGAECMLSCGTARNPPRQVECVFVNCTAPIDCGGGVFVCNRECPL